MQQGVFEVGELENPPEEPHGGAALLVPVQLVPEELQQQLGQGEASTDAFRHGMSNNTDVIVVLIGFFAEAIRLPNIRVPEAVHGPEQPQEARQEPLGHGAGAAEAEAAGEPRNSKQPPAAAATAGGAAAKQAVPEDLHQLHRHRPRALLEDRLQQRRAEPDGRRDLLARGPQLLDLRRGLRELRQRKRAQEREDGPEEQDLRKEPPEEARPGVVLAIATPIPSTLVATRISTDLKSLSPVIGVYIFYIFTSYIVYIFRY